MIVLDHSHMYNLYFLLEVFLFILALFIFPLSTFDNDYHLYVLIVLYQGFSWVVTLFIVHAKVISSLEEPFEVDMVDTVSDVSQLVC